MGLRKIKISEVIDPIEIEQVYGSFVGYMYRKLDVYLADPDTPVLVGGVTVSVKPAERFDSDLVEFIMEGFTEDE